MTTAATWVRVRGLRTIKAEEPIMPAAYLVKVLRLAGLPVEGGVVCLIEGGLWTSHVVERVDLIELPETDGEASPAYQIVFAFEDYTAERDQSKRVLDLAEGAGWVRIKR